MRRRAGKSVGAVVLVVAAAVQGCAPSPASPASRPATASAPASPGAVTALSGNAPDPLISSEIRALRNAPTEGFVKTCGRMLCVRGRPFQLYAASVYGNLGRPRASIQLARAAGLNTLRLTNFLKESDPLEEAATRERDWQRVDRFLALAAKARLRVILDLSTYRNLLRRNGVNPYAFDWGPWLEWVARRVNTVNGRTYASDPAIAVISLAGEPEPVSRSLDPLAASSTDALTSFYTRSLRQLRQADGLHLISTGGLLHYGWQSGIDWPAIFAAADMCTIHGFSADDLAALPAIADHCADHGLPLVVEEFGFPQSLGDPRRASAYRRTFEMISSLGVAGIGFWNLGPDVRPDSHDVNRDTPMAFAVIRERAGLDRWR